MNIGLRELFYMLYIDFSWRFHFEVSFYEWEQYENALDKDIREPTTLKNKIINLIFNAYLI